MIKTCDGCDCFTDFAGSGPGGVPTHIASYAVGVLVWLGSVWVGASLFPETPYASVIAGLIVGATFTSLYFYWLYVTALGAPMGNLLAPSALLFGTPFPMYALLSPANPTLGELNSLYSYNIWMIISIDIALFGPIGLCYVWYSFGDRSEWESRVLTETFRPATQLATTCRSTETPPLIPMKTMLKEVVLATPIVFVEFWLFAVVSVLFLDEMGLESDQLGGTVSVLVVCLYVPIRLSIDSDR